MNTPTEKQQKDATATLRVQLYSYFELDKELGELESVPENERETVMGYNRLVRDRKKVQQMATDSELYGDLVAVGFMFEESRFRNAYPKICATGINCDTEPKGWGK